MKYPVVSIGNGKKYSCYLEMDGLADRTEWQVRFEIFDADGFEPLIKAETKQHQERVTAEVEVIEGLKFRCPVHIYTRYDSGPVGESMLDVTIMGTGVPTIP